MTKEEVREYLSGQLWEREITELIPNLALTRLKPEDLTINKIFNSAYEVAENYLDTNITDELVKQFIDYEEFGEFLANEDDIMTYFESSGRIVVWEC